MSIENHEFSDSIAHVNCTNADENNITIKTNGAEWIFLDKSDVVALAKHFKLTKEDLE